MWLLRLDSLVKNIPEIISLLKQEVLNKGFRLVHSCFISKVKLFKRIIRLQALQFNWDTNTLWYRFPDWYKIGSPHSANKKNEAGNQLISFSMSIRRFIFNIFLYKRLQHHDHNKLLCKTGCWLSKFCDLTVTLHWILMQLVIHWAMAVGGAPCVNLEQIESNVQEQNDEVVIWPFGSWFFFLSIYNAGVSPSIDTTLHHMLKHCV